MSNAKWKDRDGHKWYPKDMTNAHIINAMRTCQIAQETYGCTPKNGVYNLLVNEAQKRNILPRLRFYEPKVVKVEPVESVTEEWVNHFSGDYYHPEGGMIACIPRSFILEMLDNLRIGVTYSEPKCQGKKK